MAIKLDDKIVECVPYDKSIPSITALPCDRGYFILHARYDTWIFPWFFKEIDFNIAHIYLPSNCAYVISSVPGEFSSYGPDYVEVKPCIYPNGRFPNGIKIRSAHGILPLKVTAGMNIAMLQLVPVMDCHVVT